MDLSSIGKHIREARLRKSMRQEQLAAEVGLSVPYIGALERSEKIPKLETFIRLVNALDMPVEFVLEDVTNNGYKVRMSRYLDRIEELPEEKRKQLFKLIDAMLDD